jgi:hypothetical protein
VDPAPYAILRLEDERLVALSEQFETGDEPGDASSDDHYTLAGLRPWFEAFRRNVEHFFRNRSVRGWRRSLIDELVSRLPVGQRLTGVGRFFGGGAVQRLTRFSRLGTGQRLTGVEGSGHNALLWSVIGSRKL